MRFCQRLGLKVLEGGTVDGDYEQIALRRRGGDSQSFKVQRGMEYCVHDSEGEVFANEDGYASSSSTFKTVPSNNDKVRKGGDFGESLVSRRIMMSYSGEICVTVTFAA